MLLILILVKKKPLREDYSKRFLKNFFSHLSHTAEKPGRGRR